MKVIKVKKKDSMTVKRFGTAEAGIDLESDTGKYFLRAESSILHGFRHSLANTPVEIEQQAKDLKTAIAFMEKENA